MLDSQVLNSAKKDIALENVVNSVRNRNINGLVKRGELLKSNEQIESHFAYERNSNSSRK